MDGGGRRLSSGGTGCGRRCRLRQHDGVTHSRVHPAKVGTDDKRWRRRVRGRCRCRRSGPQHHPRRTSASARPCRRTKARTVSRDNAGGSSAGRVTHTGTYVHGSPRRLQFAQMGRPSHFSLRPGRHRVQCESVLMTTRYDGAHAHHGRMCTPWACGAGCDAGSRRRPSRRWPGRGY